MSRRSLSGLVACVLVLGGRAAAQSAPPADEVVRIDRAVRAAFAVFYALPKDTAGVEMGAWVLDTDATTAERERTGRWRILVSKLTDTGKDLHLSAAVGGTTPAQIAASVVAMKRLEGKISRAEADATLDIVVALDEPAAAATEVSGTAERSQPNITGADSAVRIRGAWLKMNDPELEIEYERWSPPTLVVRFGRLSVQAHGADEMIDRLIREAKWEALAAVVKQ